MQAEEVAARVSIAARRCSSVVSRIGSTEWMRNGSMIVRTATAEVSSRGRKAVSGSLRIPCAAMPLRNRVTPLSELVADPARGLVYGNRGCLHDDSGEIRRLYGVKRWIACRLEFRGRLRRPLLQPGRYTELFFLDEATAMAAGHRACAECRRADYVRLTEILGARADEIDARLHAERLAPGTPTRRLHDAPLDEIPDGAFVLRDDAPWLVLGAQLLRWTPAGYTDRRPRPTREHALLITPPSLVAVLRTGWQPLVPLIHPSAVTTTR